MIDLGWRLSGRAYSCPPHAGSTAASAVRPLSEPVEVYAQRPVFYGQDDPHAASHRRQL